MLSRECIPFTNVLSLNVSPLQYFRFLAGRPFCCPLLFFGSPFYPFPRLKLLFNRPPSLSDRFTLRVPAATDMRQHWPGPFSQSSRDHC